jgi:hypothetical protein
MYGPYETYLQASETPAVRAVYATFREAPGTGAMAPHNRRMIEDACRAAGAELGFYDRRIVAWLAGWEPQICAVVAGLIRRARGHARELAAMDAVQLETVLDALADAAEYRSVRAGARCPDCDAGYGDLCYDHAGDVERADAYGQLAQRLQREAGR